MLAYAGNLVKKKDVNLNLREDLFLPIRTPCRKRTDSLGSMIYKDEFRTAIDLLKSGEMMTDLVISEVLTLESLPQALANFRCPERVKTLVRMP